MLIEFSVENHRAVSERQTFSMVAADENAIDRLEPPNHVVKTGHALIPRILADACVFGANGAGKTSLVDAMAFMVNFVRKSPDREPDSDTPVQAFRLHSKWRRRASEFEVTFLHAKTVFRYGFAATRKRVTEEWLLVGDKKSGEWRSIFEREYKPKNRRYKWLTEGINSNGNLRVWKSQTRSNALFLSTSVKLNAKGDLKNAYDWIASRFRMYSLSEGTSGHSYTSSRFDEDGWKKRVQSFFADAGVILDDIGIEKVDILKAPEIASLPEDVKDAIRKQTPGGKMLIVYFLRLDDKGRLVTLGLGDESKGIKELFDLAGPILDTLDKGYTIVVDELNLGLHPLVIENMISMFCNRKINTKNAQIIFTTHDPTIVANAFLEYDQIWIVKKEKNTLGARVERLPEFNDSDIKNFVRDYLAGSFGGVPEIRRQL